MEIGGTIWVIMVAYYGWLEWPTIGWLLTPRLPTSRFRASDKRGGHEPEGETLGDRFRDASYLHGELPTSLCGGVDIGC